MVIKIDDIVGIRLIIRRNGQKMGRSTNSNEMMNDDGLDGILHEKGLEESIITVLLVLVTMVMDEKK